MSGGVAENIMTSKNLLIGMCTYGVVLASFPGLHTQLLSLAVRKVGEGLDGLIT